VQYVYVLSWTEDQRRLFTTEEAAKTAAQRQLAARGDWRSDMEWVETASGWWRLGKGDDEWYGHEWTGYDIQVETVYETDDEYVEHEVLTP
jgi:hypothetical protein